MADELIDRVGWRKKGKIREIVLEYIKNHSKKESNTLVDSCSCSFSCVCLCNHDDKPKQVRRF